MRIPWRIQIALVVSGYMLAVGIAALLIAWRYWQYMNNPADVTASGGMWAGGDLVLEYFIVGMLLVVTFFLLLVIYKFESAYNNYAKIMLVLSTTAPIAVAMIAIPAVSEGNSLVCYSCLFRIFASPLVLLGLGMSRLFARFAKAKRIMNYALLIELFTLVFMILMLILPIHFHAM